MTPHIYFDLTYTSDTNNTDSRQLALKGKKKSDDFIRGLTHFAACDQSCCQPLFVCLPPTQVSDLKVLVDRKDTPVAPAQKTEKGEKGDRGETGLRGQSGLDVSMTHRNLTDSGSN